VRASAWTDLPAFDIGDVVDVDGNVIDTVPPSGAHSLTAGYGVWHSDSSGSVSYFGGINNPPNIAGLRTYIDAGGAGGGWNYYPGLEDEWSSADISVPSPPRDNGPFAYGYGVAGGGGATRLGQRSVNENHWFLLGYNTVAYSKSTAYGVLTIPSNHTLATYFNDTVQTYLPAGSGDDSWSWVETNGDAEPTPIVPSSVEMRAYIEADAARSSGTIEIYAHWLTRDNAEISDLWVEDVPRAGWTYLGAMPYAQAAGWTSTTVDISGLVADGDYPLGVGYADYRIALTFRNNPNIWVDPALGEPADGPYVYDVVWSYTSMLAHYDTGALKYRFVGPEVIEGGVGSPGSHIGIVMSGSDVTLKLVTEGTITDSVSWPYSLSEYAAGAIAVARPGTRAGNRATFLARSSGSFHLVHCTALPSGVLNTNVVNLSSGQVYITGYAPELFGGNETSRILMGVNTVSGYRYAVLDVDTGVQTTVTGIYPSSGVEERADIVAFSQGSTFLLMNYTNTEAGPADLTIQRYTISSSGAATAVGPKMALPSVTTPDRVFDAYAAIGPGDVWDDGEYVAVGILYSRDYPYADVTLKLAIFNNINSVPLHILTLHNDPTQTLWVSNTSTIAFSSTATGYAVSYARMSKRPVSGSTRSEEWQTYVSRSINPVTGDLGPEVFGSDSDYGGFFYPLIRADAGSTLAYIERYPPENAYPSKIAMLNASPGSGSEGVRTLVPWRGFYSVPGYTNAFAWVGINGYGGAGRLYFKYRRP